MHAFVLAKAQGPLGLPEEEIKHGVRVPDSNLVYPNMLNDKTTGLA